jgi:hypothetical protein
MPISKSPAASVAAATMMNTTTTTTTVYHGIGHHLHSYKKAKPIKKNRTDDEQVYMFLNIVT